MWAWMGVTVAAATVAVSLGCAQTPPKLKPVIEDKIYRDAHIDSHEVVQTDGWARIR